MGFYQGSLKPALNPEHGVKQTTTTLIVIQTRESVLSRPHSTILLSPVADSEGGPGGLGLSYTCMYAEQIFFPLPGYKLRPFQNWRVYAWNHAFVRILRAGWGVQRV